MATYRKTIPLRKPANIGVFINCPFDDDYVELFDAITFAIFDCGFQARCALEVVDSGTNRFDNICALIRDCKFGVHDISRTELDPDTNLPRFNMPLELGLFLGARKFSDRNKACLILDKERYRFHAFISDIGGQDIKSHEGNPRIAIACVRDWLNASLHKVIIPGGATIWKRYQQYRIDLPEICSNIPIDQNELTFIDKRDFISYWLTENTKPSP